jgi:FtsP/CotA-like multicopper oxidase with cupredoxin domain
VNQLPPAPNDAEHALEEPEMLGPNPTNLHTHGLIVEPRRAGHGDSSYGDYVYVLGYPPGHIPGMQHPGLDYTDQPIDYDIYVPENHPSGLFWFHPHVHGLALNQVSKGLAGLITIGDVNDYLNDVPGKSRLNRSYRVRHMVLKDMQVESSGDVDDQEDPNFCAATATDGDGDDRTGACSGQTYSDDSGIHDHLLGKWFFTVNGQVFPEVNVNAGTGEVWRLLNASGSRSYALSLVDDKSGKPLQFQVLSIDGISIDSAQPGNDISERSGGKVSAVPCEVQTKGIRAICATELRMMPSSRVEIWVSSRQSEKAGSATFITRDYSTGADADDWPAAKLAHVIFHRGTSKTVTTDTLAVAPTGRMAFEPNGVLGNVPRISLPGVSKSLSFNLAKQISSGELKATDPNLAAKVGDAGSAREIRSLTQSQLQNVRSLVSASQDPNCKALAPGHRRRIFFGVPAGTVDGFGLGYEEIDRSGRPVQGTFKEVLSFDHMSVSICLPLAPGNTPVTEEWELVNIAGEDHNFHIHQTKFRVLPKNAPAGDASVLMDNVAVPHGSDGCDGSVEAWRDGGCTVAPIHVAIPFSEVGDFVYHCHILEHEDGGMMAHIRVVGN